MKPLRNTIRLLSVLLLASAANADCGSWTQLFPRTAPAGGSLRAMVYDSSRKVAVLFGGPNGAPNNETWEWNGADWNQRTPATSPLRRLATAMAYDSARHVTVLFGGSAFDPNTGAYDSNETWEWDGTNWTQRTPATSPPGRYFHAMAYDSTRGVTVLFGGFQSGSNILADTWEWDGTDWTERSPADAPAPHEGHAMTFDSLRGVTVLFGGQSNNQTTNETWEWDGDDWSQRSPAHQPGVRRDLGLAFDSAAGVTVLFGGVAPGFVNPNDTWRWNGDDWSLASPATSPPVRDGHAMCYDAARKVSVIFGGSGGGNLSDTWQFAPGNSIDSQPESATHCAGETATFSITATGTNLAYQWQLSTNGGSTFENVATGTGGTAESYTTDALAITDNGARFRCVVTSDCDTHQFSSTATLTVNDCAGNPPDSPSPTPNCGLCGTGITAMSPLALLLFARRESRRRRTGEGGIRTPGTPFGRTTV